MRNAMAKPDTGLVGAPQAGRRNPTITLFIVAVGGFCGSTVSFSAGRLPLAASAVFNTLSLYCLYTVTHEAVHHLAHRSPLVNDWIGRMSAALEGLTFPMFRIIHLQHHAFNNDPDRDPDFVMGRQPSLLL